MKHELKYAVVYDDGTWGGLFSSKHNAIRIAAKRRRKSQSKCLGVFMIAKGLTRAALPNGPAPEGGAK